MSRIKRFKDRDGHVGHNIHEKMSDDIADFVAFFFFFFYWLLQPTCGF
jgi:hypothetical protein